MTFTGTPVTGWHHEAAKRELNADQGEHGGMGDTGHSASWQQLIDQAGQSQGQGDGAGMSLASVGGGDKPGWYGGDGGGQGGTGATKSEKAAWTKAGEGVGSLRGNIKKALGDLERDQKGFNSGSGTGRTESGSAQ